MSKRYIDADKLRKDVEDLHDCYNGFSDTYDKACIIGLIDEQPTADVVERKKGKWISRKNEPKHKYWWTCSECQGRFDYEWKFCPNCGADMREESDNES